MQIKRFLFIVFLSLVHLHLVAGELINIKDLASLRPVIAVTVTAEQAQQLKNDLQLNAPGVLGLYLLLGDTPATSAVAGEYQLKGRTLSFVPAHSLGADLGFEIQYRQGADIISSRRMRTPAAVSSGTIAKVVTAYPLSDTIPYNTLFFHVRFDRQMSPNREAYKHIRVYDANGAERTKAWRQRSFWLDNDRVLVLMIHPGRVKNGIHHDGPLFDSGKYYKLVVDKDIRDVNGNPIAADYVKEYFIAGEDRVQPVATVNYKNLPSAATNEPLLLSFSEGMDHASVIDGLTLIDENQEQVACAVQVKNNDKQYVITPSRSWQKGKYTLILKSAVYDFAANRINRPFEIKDAQDVEKDKLVTTFDLEIK